MTVSGPLNNIFKKINPFVFHFKRKLSRSEKKKRERDFGKNNIYDSVLAARSSLSPLCSRDFWSMVTSVIYALGLLVTALVIYLSDVFVDRTEPIYLSEVRTRTTYSLVWNNEIPFISLSLFLVPEHLFVHLWNFMADVFAF